MPGGTPRASKWRQAGGSWLAGAAFLLPSALFVFGIAGHTSRLTLSFHGLFHTASVYQIVNGIDPTTNPCSLGVPTNHIAGYYHLLALPVRAFSLSPLRANLLLNALALGLMLTALWIATARLSEHRASRLAACLLPFFLLNPLGLARFASRQLGSLLETGRLAAVPMPTVAWLGPVESLAGIVLDSRAGNPLAKFLNFNAMPVGMALFAAALALLTASRRRRPALAAACAGCGLLLALLYPHAAAGAALAALAAGVVATAGTSSEPLRSRWLPALALGAGMLAAAPLALQSAQHVREPLSLAGISGLWTNAIAVGWALLPVGFVIAVALPFRHRLHEAGRTCLVATVLLCAAGVGTSLPAQTQYKFALFSVFPAALLALDLAPLLTARIRSPRLRRVLGHAGRTGGIAAGMAAVAATATLYLGSDWSHQDPYVSRGRTLELADYPGSLEHADRREAYRWLRENTPADAYVLERPMDRNHIELSAVTQRRVVATLPDPTFTGHLAYQDALATRCGLLVQGLARCEPDRSILHNLLEMPLPWPQRFYALAPVDPRQVQHREECAARLPPGMSLQFQNGSYRIFALETWMKAPGR